MHALFPCSLLLIKLQASNCVYRFARGRGMDGVSGAVPFPIMGFSLSFGHHCRPGNQHNLQLRNGSFRSGRAATSIRIRVSRCGDERQSGEFQVLFAVSETQAPRCSSLPHLQSVRHGHGSSLPLRKHRFSHFLMLT